MDAEDVAQETMLRIWNNMDEFKMKAAKAYIIKTTHNLCIDYLRRRKRNQQKELFFEDELDDKFYENEDLGNPENAAHQKMMNEKITEAVNVLPENLKSVFVLYEVEGFQYKEISEVLNLPMNGVKVNLFRARKKLRELLKNYKPEEVI